MKICQGKESWNCYYPEDFSFCDYTANCHPDVVVCNNQTLYYYELALQKWDAWLFFQELPAYGQGVHGRNGYSARN
jgi:hypothetical protein